VRSISGGLFLLLTCGLHWSEDFSLKNVLFGNNYIDPVSSLTEKMTDCDPNFYLQSSHNAKDTLPHLEHPFGEGLSADTADHHRFRRSNLLLLPGLGRGSLSDLLPLPARSLLGCPLSRCLFDIDEVGLNFVVIIPRKL